MQASSDSSDRSNPLATPGLKQLALLFLPTNGGLFFLLILGLMLYQRPMMLLWDGGAVRHITTGMMMLVDHIVPHTNYLWAINPQHPWWTHEYFADYITAIIYIAMGLRGMVCLFSLMIAFSLLWAFQFARARGLGTIPSMLGLVIVMYTASIHWSARPHVYSYVPYIAFYFFLFCWQGSHKVRNIAIFILSLFWANVHGSYFMGVLMIVSKLVGDLLTAKPDAAEAMPLVSRIDTFKDNAITLGTSILAGFLNESGVMLIFMVLRYLNSPVILNNSDEWRSIDFTLSPALFVMFGTCCAVFLLLFYAPRKPRLGELAWFLIMFAASVYSMRIIPYFMLMVLPVAAPAWASWTEWVTASGGMKWLNGALNFDHKISLAEPNGIKLAAVWTTAAAVACGVWLAMPQFNMTDFDPQKMPIEASNYLKEHDVQGLGFIWDNWGGYLNWKLKKPQYIDDFTDWYPKDFVDEYATIYYMKPGWEEAMAKRNFAWILVPRSLPLAITLRRDPRWKVVVEEPSSVLLMRSDKP